jgi:hypothetical protein
MNYFDSDISRNDRHYGERDFYFMEKNIYEYMYLNLNPSLMLTLSLKQMRNKTKCINHHSKHSFHVLIQLSMLILI